MKLFIKNPSNPLVAVMLQELKNFPKKISDHFGFLGRIVSSYSTAIYDRNGCSGDTLGKDLEEGAVEAVIYLGEITLMCPPKENISFESSLHKLQTANWPTEQRLVGLVRVKLYQDKKVIEAYKINPNVIVNPLIRDPELESVLNS